MVRRMLDEGQGVAEVAAAFEVGPRTVYKWLACWKTTERAGLAIDVAIDGFVAGIEAAVVTFQAPGDLFGAPALPQVRVDMGKQCRTTQDL